MRDEIQHRLDELTEQYQEGEKMLAEVELRRQELQQTLLRISGAVQVLEELLNPDDAAEKAA